MTVPDLLRREAARLAARPTVGERLQRTRHRSSDLTTKEVLEAFDEMGAPGPMLIVDASCLYEVIIASRRGETIRARLAADQDQAAPHAIDVEILGVVRRHEIRGRLDRTAAAQAIDDLRAGRESASPTEVSSVAHGNCATPYAVGTPCMWHSPKRPTALCS